MPTSIAHASCEDEIKALFAGEPAHDAYYVRRAQLPDGALDPRLRLAS